MYKHQLKITVKRNGEKPISIAEFRKMSVTKRLAFTWFGRIEKVAVLIPGESVATTADEIIESTKDFVLKELSRNLKGYDLEDFVADLLSSMEYRTILSAHGGDSGIDITAYKDELPPRILIQVKSQDGDIKETTIQSLKGCYA